MIRLLKRLFRRLSSALRGGGPDPSAALERERERLRAEILRSNEALSSHASLCERIMHQVREAEEKECQLRERAECDLREGRREAAAEAALRRKALAGELAGKRRSLEEAVQVYSDLVSARDRVMFAARERIEGLKAAIGELEREEAMAEIARLSGDMVSRSCEADDSFRRAVETVHEQRDRAAGRSRVARDLLERQ